MKNIVKNFYYKECYMPSFLFGIWINPFFIIRRGLFRNIKKISNYLKGGKLLDFGCGSKPYEKLFNVDQYIGVDVKKTGHNHINSKIDVFYDGKVMPFRNNEFDHIFTSEVIEHIFNIEDVLIELNRILKKGGFLGLTCPFVWDEHEKPYDFARYSSFGIKHLLKKNNFQIIKIYKSTNYFETIIQMFTAYIYQHCFPKNKILKIFLSIFFISPINIFGILLGKLLPKNYDFFHNNIIIAKKL